MGSQHGLSGVAPRAVALAVGLACLIGWLPASVFALPVTAPSSPDPNVLYPTDMTVTVPAGSNNPAGAGTSSTPFVDDALLTTITFGGTTFSVGADSFRDVLRAGVITNRDDVNAEFGDSDTGSDGNPNPFVTAGIINEGDPLPSGTRESTDPAIQDPAIAAAFSSLSIVQGVDGEGADYSFDLIFENGIVDNDAAADVFPELVFLERGLNSDFQVQAIIGGTFDSPIFAPNTVDVNRSAMGVTPFYINTIEIGSGQQLDVAGLDINVFGGGLGASQPIYGIRLTSTNGSGADMYGQFLSATGSDQFRPVPFALSGIPEPGTGVLLAVGLGALLRRRRRAG